MPAHDKSNGFQFGPVLPWDGGDCPVPHDTVVRCFFRNRAPYVGAAVWLPQIADSMWQHAPAAGRTNPGADIIYYQVMTGVYDASAALSVASHNQQAARGVG